MAKLFFSYSHADEKLRDRLETHLHPLKREGVIEGWHDRRIKPGDEFDSVISEHLETADVILLLISADFLASRYCYDIEMKRALERHAAGEARVIPVILDFCDWKTSPFAKLMALPTDGRELSMYANLNEGLLNVVKGIRSALPALKVKESSPSVLSQSRTAFTNPTPEIRSSNLQLRRTFTDHDRDVFKEQAFEFLATFFQQSLKELEERNPGITQRFKRVDANRFTAHIYRDGKANSQCSIYMGSNMLGGNGIFYSSETSAVNSFEGSLTVVDDGVSLMLKSVMGNLFGGQEGMLTLQGAAEEFWSKLINRLR